MLDTLHTWPHNCIWNLALPQQIFSPEFGVHQAPTDVVQYQSDWMEPATSIGALMPLTPWTLWVWQR